MNTKNSIKRLQNDGRVVLFLVLNSGSSADEGHAYDEASSLLSIIIIIMRVMIIS